jgi:hypothetical protein
LDALACDGLVATVSSEESTFARSYRPISTTLDHALVLKLQQVILDAILVRDNLHPRVGSK